MAGRDRAVPKSHAGLEQGISDGCLGLGTFQLAHRRMGLVPKDPQNLWNGRLRAIFDLWSRACWAGAEQRLRPSAPAVHIAQPVAFLAGGSPALLGWGNHSVSREALNTEVVTRFYGCMGLLALPGDILVVPRGGGCVQLPGKGAQERAGGGQPEEECLGRHHWSPLAGSTGVAAGLVA